jgi:hypothetical protein
MTHTHANLEVSDDTYNEIRRLLKAAGYDHAFLDGGAIDMHGIALVVSRGSRVTEEMVTRFLNWKLPASVLPDPCVMDTAYPHRIGTNLLTADEARQMLEHVLGGGK